MAKKKREPTENPTTITILSVINAEKKIFRKGEEMEERKKKYKKRRRGRQQQQQKMHTHTHTHTAGKWKSDGRFGREKSADLSGNRISVQTLDPQKNGGGSQRDGDADGFGIKYAHTRRRGGSIDPYSRTQHTQTHRTDLGPFSRIGLVCVHVYIYAAFFFSFSLLSSSIIFSPKWFQIFSSAVLSMPKETINCFTLDRRLIFSYSSDRTCKPHFLLLSLDIPLFDSAFFFLFCVTKMARVNS